MPINQSLLDDIRAAQRAPSCHHVVAAQLRPNDPKSPILLFTTEIEKTAIAEALAQDLDYKARLQLVSGRFDPPEVVGAEIFLMPLPDARAAVDPLIDKRANDDDDPIALDYLYWEGLRLQAGLTPKTQGNQEVLIYRGVTIWQSAAG